MRTSRSLHDPATARRPADQPLSEAPASKAQTNADASQQSWLPFLIMVGLLVICRSVVLDWNHVPTGSMQPTIQIGDHIIVDKLAYDLRLPFSRTALWHRAEPQPGDIVAFVSPADDSLYVKRVVGRPGDLVALVDNVLVVNGQPARFAAIENKDGRARLVETISGHRHSILLEGNTGTAANFGPVRVPPDAWFVMGDNRLQSFDSRYFGFVDRDRILGRATRVAFSLDIAHGFKPRPDRIFETLQ